MGTAINTNRLRSRKASSITVFLCPPKVPCRIKDPNRLRGALSFSGITHLIHGGKDMRSLLLHFGNGPQKQTFSETMEADTEFRHAAKYEAKRDAKRFEEVIRLNRQRMGLEAV